MILLVLILIATPLLWWYFHIEKNPELDSIPGPKPLPFVGNANQLGFCPQDFLKSLVRFKKEYGKVFKVFVGPELKTIVSKPELIEDLLSSNTLIRKSNIYELLKIWLGEGLLISDGDKWRSRRKLITPSFHFKILDQFVRIFNSSAQTLVEKLDPFVGKPSVDVFPYINLCSLDNICETSMGIKVNAQKDQNSEYITSVREFLNLFVQRLFSSWKQFDFLFKLFSPDYKVQSNYLKTLHEFTVGIISKRRKEIANSDKSTVSEQVSEEGIKKRIALLDLMLTSEERYNLSDEDIRAEIDTFMFEGHDTTTSAMAFTILALADNPQVQRKVLEEAETIIGDSDNPSTQQLNELKYLDMTIKEVLRMYPSVPYVERKLPTSAVLDGQKFPKDSIIGIFIYGMNHSEDVFPEPEKFDPERFSAENQAQRHNYCYVPFSAGPRNCIGQRFAILEVKSIVSKMVRKFRILPVPNYKPDLGMAAILKSYNGVNVRLEHRTK